MENSSNVKYYWVIGLDESSWLSAMALELRLSTTHMKRAGEWNVSIWKPTHSHTLMKSN